jgi:hypothetical protein
MIKMMVSNEKEFKEAKARYHNEMIFEQDLIAAGLPYQKIEELKRNLYNQHSNIYIAICIYCKMFDIFISEQHGCECVLCDKNSLTNAYKIYMEVLKIYFEKYHIEFNVENYYSDLYSFLKDDLRESYVDVAAIFYMNDTIKRYLNPINENTSIGVDGQLFVKDITNSISFSIKMMIKYDPYLIKFI